MWKLLVSLWCTSSPRYNMQQPFVWQKVFGQNYYWVTHKVWCPPRCGNTAAPLPNFRGRVNRERVWERVCAWNHAFFSYSFSFSISFFSSGRVRSKLQATWESQIIYFTQRTQRMAQSTQSYLGLCVCIYDCIMGRSLINHRVSQSEAQSFSEYRGQA